MPYAVDFTCNGHPCVLTLHDFETNGEGGGWHNATVLVDGERISVGGGWIANARMSDESGQFPSGEPVLREGEFDPYDVRDAGDLNHFCAAVGLNYGDWDGERSEAVEAVQAASREAFGQVSIAQRQLDRLGSCSGMRGTPHDLSHVVEDLGFLVRECDETGDALVILQGGCDPDGSDTVAARIVWREDAEDRAVILV